MCDFSIILPLTHTFARIYMHTRTRMYTHTGTHTHKAAMHSSMVMSIQHFITNPLDVTLVDNTPRLLEILNRTERLSKLLNKRDDRGYTLLHAAAERNQPESLKCLLIKEGMFSCLMLPQTSMDTMQQYHKTSLLGDSVCHERSI